MKLIYFARFFSDVITLLFIFVLIFSLPLTPPPPLLPVVALHYLLIYLFIIFIPGFYFFAFGSDKQKLNFRSKHINNLQQVRGLAG